MQVWDIRTKANVHTLTGHTNTVATVRCQAAEPQIITGTIMFFQIAHNSSINPSVRQALKWFLFTLVPNVCREPRFNHQAVGSDCWENQSNSYKPQEVCANSGPAPQTVSGVL